MWATLTTFVETHRRRIATAVLVLFVLVVGLDLAHTVPRETHLAIELGAHHREVRAIELSYVAEEQAALTARRRFPDGAPSRIEDTLDLVPGRYEVRMDLAYEDGHAETREGSFEAPGEGVVVVSMHE
ncbi:MAG: hypothetical protein U0234_29715 [Sandaracinus sp.]